MKLNQHFSIKSVFILLIAVLAYNHFVFAPFAEPAVVRTELNDLQMEMLSNLKEMTKLLITLSTALFGVIGYFALDSFKEKRVTLYNIRLDLVLAFSLTALSIDFGYVSMEKWVEMLSLGIFAPFDNLVRLPQLLQLLAFFGALFFAGRLVYKMLFTKRSKR